jgi:mannitol-1-phosphate/altronate dehydrogenase
MLQKKILELSSTEQFLHSVKQDDKLFHDSIHIITGNNNHISFTAYKYNEYNEMILFADKQWMDVLIYAADPDLERIVINRQQIKQSMLRDNIYGLPPSSCPGKLLSLLHWRFRKSSLDSANKLAIITRDEEAGAAEFLESLVIEMAHRNNLEPLFLDWIEKNIRFFCTTEKNLKS